MQIGPGLFFPKAPNPKREWECWEWHCCDQTHFCVLCIMPKMILQIQSVAPKEPWGWLAERTHEDPKITFLRTSKSSFLRTPSHWKCSLSESCLERRERVCACCPIAWYFPFNFQTPYRLECSSMKIESNTNRSNAVKYHKIGFCVFFWVYISLSS